MAAPNPYQRGIDHAFAVDPQATALSRMVADMAAINLQLLDRVEQLIPAGAGQAAEVAALRGMAQHVNRILDASEVTDTRERNTRELQPVTRVPAAQWGPNANIANIRMHNVSTFSGTGTDTLDVVRWISRIFMLATAHELTFNATINLMIQGSTNGAADYIEQMREEGKTLLQIVQQLEMRYGDLCTPEEARVKCNNMPRREGEGLSEFIDRLRSMARMACRLTADDNLLRQQIDQLVEGNIRRVLPVSVRTALEERVINRSRMGLPAFTAREVEKECLDLEKRRDERRDKAKDSIPGKRHPRVMKVNDDFEETHLPIPSDSSSSSEDEVEIEDSGTFHLIREIKDVRQRYAQKGKPVDPARVYRKAVRNYNDKYPPRNPRNPRGLPYARQAAGYGPPQGLPQQQVQHQGMASYNHPRPGGPPNKLDTSVKRTVPDLLALANIQKGSCIQCGIEGHYMHSDKCVLRDKILVDRPCAKCGQGLHPADDCPKVYQKDYVAPQHLQGNQANQAIVTSNEEALNQ
jgi:hypothetical protein